MRGKRCNKKSRRKKEKITKRNREHYPVKLLSGDPSKSIKAYFRFTSRNPIKMSPENLWGYQHLFRRHSVHCGPLSHVTSLVGYRNHDFTGYACYELGKFWENNYIYVKTTTFRAIC
jgi:hypothetical protein